LRIAHLFFTLRLSPVLFTAFCFVHRHPSQLDLKLRLVVVRSGAAFSKQAKIMCMLYGVSFLEQMLQELSSLKRLFVVEIDILKMGWTVFVTG
jgi:hypothetical protein